MKNEIKGRTARMASAENIMRKISSAEKHQAKRSAKERAAEGASE